MRNERRKNDDMEGKQKTCVYWAMYMNMSGGANDKWLFPSAYVWYSIFIYFSLPFETFVTPLPRILLKWF